MGDCVRIERLTNGYEVTIRDPKIAEANAKRDSKGGSIGMWKDPQREYAFKTVAEVMTFLKANLEKALPLDDYDSAFELAAEEDDD